MLLICSGAVPEFLTVVVSVLFVFTLTFPNRRLVGVSTAAGTPAAAGVVAWATADTADSLPTPSTAVTRYWCVDDGGSPGSVNVVPVTSTRFARAVAPSLYTLYLAAPATGLQDTLICVELTAVAVTPVGADGGVWSAGGGTLGADARRPCTVMRFVSTKFTPGPPTSGPSTRKTFVAVPITRWGVLASPMNPGGAAGSASGSHFRK